MHNHTPDNNLYKNFDAVLTFDYENLNTEIEKTAEDLQERLRDAGLFDHPEKRLTIVAHSMGGLVSRYFIEQLDGAKVVKQLIMVGTPNGGSEVSAFRRSVSGLLTLVLNHTSMSPYVPMLTGMGKLTFKTLEQMDTSSEFIRKLNESLNAPSVRYNIVGGDTSLKSNDPLYIYNVIARLIFKGEVNNDIAVTLKSILKLPQAKQFQQFVVDCDHLNYFSDPATLAQIAKWIK